jgi:asparagine synthase (glutamine-hydrolysing)
MCGIVGAVGIADRSILDEMVRRIAHRGPDDEGVWLDERSETPVMLGSRRLAILDLSSAGHMPMHSTDGRLSIVYNGEIYNFREIRQDLENTGAVFRSNTDTEVILAAFREWGPDCLTRFNGMFAIAIWDARDRTLFLARDRAGVKPLYYTQKAGTLFFGSEIKSLLVGELSKPQLSRRALACFLRYHYVPWPDTLFDGVRKLPPAHFALFRNGRLTVERYWRPPDPHTVPEASTEDLTTLLESAVKLRLISDVPVGTFLSGGIDSALVATLAARDLPDLISYTVAFDAGGKRFDEVEAARSIADFAGIKNKVVNCSIDGNADILPLLIWHLDEPIADNLIYPFYALCRSARQSFTVALSGEGADEILFGYRQYTLERARTVLGRAMPQALRRAVSARLASRDISTSPRWRALAYVMADSPEAAFHAWAGAFFSPPELRELLAAEWRDDGDLQRTMQERLPKTKLLDSGDVSPFYDFHFRLVDYILTVRDKMSMAVGLELRTPFLDYRLIEAAFSVRARNKVRGTKTKVALRRVAAKILPAAASRRRKIPFSAPMHLWLGPLVERFLTEPELVRGGILTAEGVNRWSASGPNGRFAHANKLWSLVVLEVWYRIFITGSLRPELARLDEEPTTAAPAREYTPA